MSSTEGRTQEFRLRVEEILERDTPHEANEIKVLCTPVRLLEEGQAYVKERQVAQSEHARLSKSRGAKTSTGGV